MGIDRVSILAKDTVPMGVYQERDSVCKIILKYILITYTEEELKAWESDMFENTSILIETY